jgi:putative SOS response-associated peptidase YedK
MCYHYDAAGNKKAMKRFEFLKKSEEYSAPKNANAFAFPKMPIVTNKNPDTIQLFNWGLMPHWASKEKVNELKKTTLNARAETIFDLNSFREAATHNRCLVLADSFYEWRTVGRTRIPYLISLKNNETFAMGGIWSVWKSVENGEEHHTFSIVTVPANPLMAYIHNTKLRMPLILPYGTEENWIDPSLSQQQISGMMLPFDQSQMAATIIVAEGDQLSLF